MARGYVYNALMHARKRGMEKRGKEEEKAGTLQRRARGKTGKEEEERENGTIDAKVRESKGWRDSGHSKISKRTSQERRVDRSGIG